MVEYQGKLISTETENGEIKQEYEGGIKGIPFDSKELGQAAALAEVRDVLWGLNRLSIN